MWGNRAACKGGQGCLGLKPGIFFLTPDLMLPNTVTGDNWLHSKFVSSMLFDNPLSFP